MSMMFGRPVLKNIQRTISVIFVWFIFICVLPNTVSSSDKTEITGCIYEFGKDSHYEFCENNDNLSKQGKAYGVFSVSGNISNVSLKDGVPSYQISDGNLDFFYTYRDNLLTAEEDSWHLIGDKSKKIGDISLDSNIMKGAIILQTSKDRKTWINIKSITNAFSDIPVRTGSIYSTTDIQLINGCFYRIIVVYELGIKTNDSKFLFINTDKHEYKKYAEVYEFYAYTGNTEEVTVDPNQTYNLGSKVRVKNFDGYSGEEMIDQNDIHYGWELGRFFVSGYTDKTTNADGDVVFLKNVGDKTTLWFALNENINALQGNNKLTITADAEGYDQYFETPRMNFGRGALIIRYTDYNNVSSEPIIYTNFLEANTTIGTDTKVNLFEEGDYEVALNYEVTSNKLINKIGHYRIFFKFSVRNGNCMVYPFDIVSGSELSNSSMTENGFRLDLAKSRYLKVNIKREVMKDSADGLVEDTRFNGPVKDGAEYTNEGIYTITVHNEYTKQVTVKKIYVGTNMILRAYMTTGLSIPKINELVSQGATISQDGTIQLAKTTSPTELHDGIAVFHSEDLSNPKNQFENPDKNNTSTFLSIVLIVCIVVITLTGIIIVIQKRKTVETKNDVTKKGSNE